MLVPVVLDHAVAAYADVWARDLHPSQGDPGDRDSGAGADTRKGEAPRPARPPPPPPVHSPPCSPVENVIILATPAPVFVGEAVNPQELGFTQARHTSKVAGIGQPGTRKKAGVGGVGGRPGVSPEGGPEMGREAPGLGAGAWVRLRWEPSPEAELVHGNGEVAGLVATAVQVAVIHGDQVHVTEDEAVVGGVLLQRL